MLAGSLEWRHRRQLTLLLLLGETCFLSDYDLISFICEVPCSVFTMNKKVYCTKVVFSEQVNCPLNLEAAATSANAADCRSLPAFPPNPDSLLPPGVHIDIIKLLRNVSPVHARLCI